MGLEGDPDVALFGVAHYIAQQIGAVATVNYIF
jgi:hypothetical protein